ARVIHQDRDRSSVVVINTDDSDARIDDSGRLANAVAPEHSYSSIRLHVPSIVAEDRLTIPDTSPSFLQPRARRADSLHNPVQRSLLPLRYPIVIFVNHRTRVCMRCDEHYVTDIVQLPDALPDRIHLRLSKRSPQIECYDCNRMATVIQHQHTSIQRIESTFGGALAITVSPEFHTRWRRDIDFIGASFEGLRV